MRDALGVEGLVRSLHPPCLTCKPTDRKVKLFAAVTHVTVYYASILLVTPQSGHERGREREREREGKGGREREREGESLVKF